MTVTELMEVLEDLNPEAEIRLMIQRHYPMQSGLYGICTDEAMKHADGDEGEEDEQEDRNDSRTESVVYLVEGAHIAYGNKKAWSVAG